MIKPSELRVVEKDVLDFYEAMVLLSGRNINGVPDQMFNHKVTARLRELWEVAQNIERASYNRDIKENEK